MSTCSWTTAAGSDHLQAPTPPNWICVGNSRKMCVYSSCMGVCACSCVAGLTQVEMSVCVCTDRNDSARQLSHGGSTVAKSHTHRCPPQHSTLPSSKDIIPPHSYLLSSTAMATSSVLESACLGNVCQGTDERTHGTLSASAGTWERGEEVKRGGLGGNQRAISPQVENAHIAVAPDLLHLKCWR